MLSHTGWRGIESAFEGPALEDAATAKRFRGGGTGGRCEGASMGGHSGLESEVAGGLESVAVDGNNFPTDDSGLEGAVEP